MPYSIQDKVCLVTGANRGIGKAIVDAFIKAGANKIYAAVRSLESVEALVKEYGSNRIIPLHIDMSQPSTMILAAQQATDVQILVNNAGVLTSNATSILDKKAVDNLQYELQVNVFGLIQLVQAFQKQLQTNAETCFIQLNSTSSFRTPTNPKLATYSASKHCSYAITQSLRDILTPHGCRVISVHPGFIATDMISDFVDTSNNTNIPPASQVGEKLVEALENGNDEFLVLPCEMSQAIGKEYHNFANNVVGPYNNKPK